MNHELKAFCAMVCAITGGLWVLVIGGLLLIALLALLLTEEGFGLIQAGAWIAGGCLALSPGAFLCYFANRLGFDWEKHTRSSIAISSGVADNLAIVTQPDAGYVYFLKNDHMPGLTKIGGTGKTPADRAKSLKTTGVPGEFEVYAYSKSDNWRAAEAKVHKALKPWRVKGGEFFRLEPDKAIQLAKPFLPVKRQGSEELAGCLGLVVFLLIVGIIIKIM